MNTRAYIAVALTIALVPIAADARGFAGAPRGGGGGFSRPSGGFDMHSEAPGSASHSSTGPAGTSRTTNVNGAPGDYSRTTTANNQNYNRTSSGSMNNGNYSHSGTTNTAYGTHSASGTANSSTGNYSRNSSGSNAYGSYNANTSGNAYTHNAEHQASGSNVYGQTYSSTSYAHDGYVTRSAVVTNPVYGAYPAWGWNAGYAWYPAPYYWGGGFWGGFAVGAATAAVYGTYMMPNNTNVTSYEVQASSPGAKLLQSYHLTQVQCTNNNTNLVVLIGPNNSVICAQPNSTVAAGTYAINEQTLTIQSLSKA